MRLSELLFEENIPEFINFMGQERPTRNSLGDYIGNSIEAIQNFYKWFGNSKVVDDQNRPLVVYHGTNKEIKKFSDKKMGRSSLDLGYGFYFTPSLGDAESFAWGRKYLYGGSQVLLKCYIKIENPLLFDNTEVGKKALEYWDKQYGSNIHNLAIKHNKDGIIRDKMGLSEEYVVFTSKQIKAVDNKGTFNLNTNNIYESISTKEILVKAYHGTPDNFNEFQFDMKANSNDQLGSGIYFTSNKDEAEKYSEGGYIIEATLSFKNPIKISPKGVNIRSVKVTPEQAFNLIKHVPDILDEYGPLSDYIDNDGEPFELYHIEDVAMQYDNLLVISNDFFYDKQELFRKVLNKELGYDGVIKTFPDGEKHYVVWFKEQIKSFNKKEVK